MMKPMERHLQVPNGEDCFDCPFYYFDPTQTGCNNGMLYTRDTVHGKRNNECLRVFPNGATIWFEQGKS